MPSRYRQTDFLIVTALDIETDAVESLLENKSPKGPDISGEVTRESSTTKYSVIVTEIGEMGTNPAQRATREALSRANPRYVILTGIAAGFPESEVNLGDVIVPRAVVPYEIAKITERKIGIRALLGRKTTEYEHRSLPIQVSYPLWYASDRLASDNTSTWPSSIRVARPDGTNRRPVVHSQATSILGSGEKIVASDLAEARKWLISEYRRQAVGLEMESYGVLTACQVTDTPFLVVKASQDFATSDKDESKRKDRWRPYAAEAAAAFTIALIRRFELQADALVLDHVREVRELVRSIEQGAPHPAFSYTVSRAWYYQDMRSGIFDTQAEPPYALIPDDLHPRYILHGGGGTGKSRIAQTLIGPLIDRNLFPVFIDLKKYSLAKKPEDQESGRVVEDVLLLSAAPRRTTRELERLAGEGKLVVVIDGINEVSRDERSSLVGYFQSLNRNGQVCYILMTDRLGPESLETFHHAAVDRLDIENVKTLFDEAFGPNSFQNLDEKLRIIYTRPFFLSLAVKTRQSFAGSKTWSNIFENFFLSQLRMETADLDLIAESTLDAFDSNGNFELSSFQQRLGEERFKLLTSVDVLSAEDGGFEHYLWRDYLVSRMLARDENRWKDQIFDAITTYSSSLECLSMTVEQLPDRVKKDNFLKKLFDWNYLAAARCIADFRENEPEARQLSLSIRSAILAAVAEKRFDGVQRTRERANEFLADHHYGFARPFVEAASEEALRQHVSTIHEPEEWFGKWKTLFTKANGAQSNPIEIELIASDDSLIGWAASNLARRSKLTDDDFRTVRGIYENTADEDKKSVRWRVVHVLGAHPKPENASLLYQALGNDPYHWVQYGAARSVIEIAARSETALREQALGEVKDFIRTYSPTKLWMRRQILQETIESSFISHPAAGWKGAVRPLLRFISQQESDPSVQSELMKRVNALDTYDESA